jgi:hypothetical protein
VVVKSFSASNGYSAIGNAAAEKKQENEDQPGRGDLLEAYLQNPGCLQSLKRGSGRRVLLDLEVICRRRWREMVQVSHDGSPVMLLTSLIEMPIHSPSNRRNYSPCSLRYSIVRNKSSMVAIWPSRTFILAPLHTGDRSECRPKQEWPRLRPSTT